MITLRLQNPNENPIMTNSIVVVSFPYSEYYSNIIKSLPFRQFTYNTKEWRITAGEIPELYKMLGVYDINIVDSSLKKLFIPDDASLEQMAEKKKQAIKERLSRVNQRFPYEWKTKPFPHQIEGFNHAVNWNNYLIADEQGLGKTITAISVMSYRHQAHLIDKCLIVCCVNSTKYNWKEEIKKHSNEDCYVIDGTTESKKLKQIAEWQRSDVLFAIINIESLRPDCKMSGGRGKPKTEGKRALDQFIFHPTGGCKVPMNSIMSTLQPVIAQNAVVVDEIHKCKNILSSRQGVALQQLQARYKLGLSGTPLTSKVMDIWNILVWLGGETRNYYDFRSAYCVMGGFNEKEIVGYKNLEDLEGRLGAYMIRRKKDEVLGLPPKIYLTEYVELTKEQKKMYEDAKEGILQVVNDEEKGIYSKEKNTSNPLALTSALREITGGLLTSDDQNQKLKRIKEMLEEEIIPNNRKAIIFTNWEAIAKIYRKELEEYNPAYIVGSEKEQIVTDDGEIKNKIHTTKVETRQEQVNKFQNDSTCKVIIGTIGAMGTGLTLTAASYVFFVDQAWNPSDNAQAEDRAHRIGTTDNVTIITMIAKDTIDEKVQEMVHEKDILTSTVIDGTATGLQKMSNRDLVRKLLS